MPRPESSSARPVPSPGHNESASFSESFFLEQMAVDGGDPLEGPSWLFASIKKKKRKSNAVRKLSCIMSDLDNTAGSSSMEESELELLETSSNNASLLKRKFGSLEQEGSSVSQPTVMLKE